MADRPAGPTGPGTAPARLRPEDLAERGVFIADEQAEVRVEARRYVALAQLALVAERVRPDAELSLLLVDEATMADLHEQFLGLPDPTDVLAFPMDDELVEPGRQPDQGGRGPGAPPETADAPLLVGDVVVCPEVARRQAVERGATLEEELDLLVVHGILHLLGHDHEAGEEQAAAMRARERDLLDLFRGSLED